MAALHVIPEESHRQYLQYLEMWPAICTISEFLARACSGGWLTFTVNFNIAKVS